MSDYLVTFRLRPSRGGDLIAWLEGFGRGGRLNAIRSAETCPPGGVAEPLLAAVGETVWGTIHSLPPLPRRFARVATTEKRRQDKESHQ